MKLEAGKYYRTRDGRKAWVAGEMPPCFIFDSLQMVGVIEHAQHAIGGVAKWTVCGEHYNYDCCDLVSEWREPVTKTTELILLADGCVSLHGNCSPSHVIARKTVTITEGEGMQ